MTNRQVVLELREREANIVAKELQNKERELDLLEQRAKLRREANKEANANRPSLAGC